MPLVPPARLFWYLAAAAAGLLLYLTAPILSPFLFSAILAYIRLLVGDRIGLRPLAVIFSLLVVGRLFGFFGVLLALPVSAALLVVPRHVRAHYLDSDLCKTL